MKFYKVIKENFLWEVGCILKINETGNGYVPTHDIYKKFEGSEYISVPIVENCPEYFQQVYEVNLVSRVVYEVKEKARELLESQFKS